MMGMMVRMISVWFFCHTGSLRLSLPLNASLPIQAGSSAASNDGSSQKDAQINSTELTFWRPEEGDSRNLLCVFVCSRLNDLANPSLLFSSG